MLGFLRVSGLSRSGLLRTGQLRGAIYLRSVVSAVYQNRVVLNIIDKLHNKKGNVMLIFFTKFHF